jgi:hypothetical protein
MIDSDKYLLNARFLKLLVDFHICYVSTGFLLLSCIFTLLIGFLCGIIVDYATRSDCNCYGPYRYFEVCFPLSPSDYCIKCNCKPNNIMFNVTNNVELADYCEFSFMNDRKELHTVCYK